MGKAKSRKAKYVRPPAQVLERPFQVGDRVLDTHGRIGTIAGVSGDAFLVAFVTFVEQTRSMISYYPSQADIAAACEGIRQPWDKHEEQARNQYPTESPGVPLIDTANIMARKPAKRSLI